MTSTDPAVVYLSAAFEDDSGIWRCSTCGWEVETDDGTRGYCHRGHHFDCTKLLNFEAVDQCDSDGDSIVSSEGWDEYEEDGWIDDEQVEDPYKFLTQSIKDIDESNCDTTMLTQAFDEIDAIDDACMVLYQTIDSIDVEEGEDGDSTDEDEEDGSDDTETLIEGEDAANKGEEDVKDRPASEVEGVTGNGDAEDGMDEEDDGESEETSSMWEGATSDGDDTSSEDEEAPSMTKTPAQLREENIAKLNETIGFLTGLYEGLKGGATTLVAQRQAGSEELGSPRVTAATPPSQDQQSPVKSEADSPTPEHQFLFDTTEIEAVVKKRRELIRNRKEDPPGNADGELDFDFNLIDLNEDLVAAIEKSRFARNVTKKRQNIPTVYTPMRR